MTTYDKVTDISKEFEWLIDDFFTIPTDLKYCLSPFFSFANESWYLGLYPNGSSEKKSVGHVGLYLFRRESGPPIHLAFSLNIKTVDGKKEREMQFIHMYEKAGGHGHPQFGERSTLLERRAELVPSDVLTIVCTLEHYSKSANNTGNKAKCPHCNQSFDDKYASTHEFKCLEKPVRCPTCKDTVVIGNWLDHECETARIEATEKLINDLDDIYNNKEHSDVIIKVKDEKFHLHKSILAGRSPYFRAMFKAEMKETNTGIVTIDDCNADVFRIYALFIYTGEVDEMTVGNVCDLYEMADKYQEDQLKKECLCFMKIKMSVESFCDFIIVALKHSENELLQNATDFFCKQTKEIIKSVKWQIFLKEYSTQANELYIKAFDSNCS